MSGDSGTSNNRNKDVPVWNGSSETFQAYQELARLYEQTTPYGKRYLCGPKLQSVLEGAALRLVVGKRADWLSDNGGVERLLEHLRRCLGKPQMPELTDLLGKYIRGSKRRPGESMNEYITRKCELYVRAQQAMWRVKPHHGSHESTGRGTDRGWPSSYRDGGFPQGRRMSTDSWTSAGGVSSYGPPEVSEQAATQAAAPTGPEVPSEARTTGASEASEAWPDRQWNRTSWTWWGQNQWDWHNWDWTSWSTSSATGEPENLPELVPEFVQAWLLLTDANLDAAERNLVLTAVQGDLNLQRIAQELRTQFPENETRRKDSQRRQLGYWGGQEPGDDSEHEEGNLELGFDAEAELNEDGLEAWQESEQEVQSAMAAVQHARRTLRGAREKQKQVKLNRQYYRGNSSGATSTENKDERITCLRCGQVGHRAANCTAPHPKDRAKIKEMAPFVCYAEGTDKEFALRAGTEDSPAPTTQEAVNEGKAILDCGATKSLGSVYALEKVMRLSQNGVSSVDLRNKPVFGFGNSSEDRCVSTLHLNLQAGGRPGQLKVHALDKGTAPILFSIASLKALGALVDFSEGTMVLREVDPEKLMYLEETQTGHLLIPLTGDLLEHSVATKTPVPRLSSFAKLAQAEALIE